MTFMTLSSPTNACLVLEKKVHINVETSCAICEKHHFPLKGN